MVFFSHQFLPHGKHHTQTPSPSAYWKSSASNCRLGISTTELGECCGPKEGPPRRKNGEKTTGDFQRAHHKLRDVCRVARIVTGVPLPSFSKLEAHATLDVTGANTISSTHTTNTIWCPPSQAASPTTQAHRDLVLSGPSYKKRISKQTSNGHGKHVYIALRKNQHGTKNSGIWKLGGWVVFFWLSHSRDDFSAPFAGNIFRVHQQPSVFRSKWHGD